MSLHGNNEREIISMQPTFHLSHFIIFFIDIYFRLRDRLPSLPLNFLLYFIIILQCIRTIVIDARFEHGTSASEAWCATNEPPHLRHIYVQLLKQPHVDSTNSAASYNYYCRTTTSWHYQIVRVNHWKEAKSQKCLWLTTEAYDKWKNVQSFVIYHNVRATFSD